MIVFIMSLSHVPTLWAQDGGGEEAPPETGDSTMQESSPDTTESVEEVAPEESLSEENLPPEENLSEENLRLEENTDDGTTDPLPQALSVNISSQEPQIQSDINVVWTGNGTT